MTLESIQAMIDQALLRNSTNRDGSHSLHGDNRRNVQIACLCFYADFMKCQPLNFKGTKGVVSLTRWIEKMESVFNISGCAIENQVKFATCTLLGAALTWWNGHKQKNLSQPKTLDETIELANDLMDQKLRTYAERQSDNKRKVDDSSRNNHGHPQQPFKRQNVAKVYNMGTGKKKPYGGSLPKCTKCPISNHKPVHPERVPQVKQGKALCPAIAGVLGNTNGGLFLHTQNAQWGSSLPKRRNGCLSVEH
ncbi:hypothetical protein Tco_0973775 [Tanacetum coccineum]|uniref:Reverse transcriptase domain-containing protein n=1 Tax=Tanacetum coccineum TaxID=301880 RepID=A0ABQ5E9Y1_9ASTR